MTAERVNATVNATRGALTYHAVVTCAVCPKAMDVRADGSPKSPAFVKNHLRGFEWSRTSVGWVCGDKCREKVTVAMKGVQ